MSVTVANFSNSGARVGVGLIHRRLDGGRRLGKLAFRECRCHRRLQSQIRWLDFKHRAKEAQIQLELASGKRVTP